MAMVGADAIGQPPADQGQRAERERGVRRHRHAPGVHRGPSGVHDQVDADRHDHAAQSDRDRQCQPAPHPQLPHVELAPRLQPHDQEEQRHQPGVHELVQAGHHARTPDQDRHPGAPHLVVGGHADVRPHQGGHRGAAQHEGAARLSAQELPQRGAFVPDRQPGKQRSGLSRRRLAHHTHPHRGSLPRAGTYDPRSQTRRKGRAWP